MNQQEFKALNDRVTYQVNRNMNYRAITNELLRIIRELANLTQPEAAPPPAMATETQVQAPTEPANDDIGSEDDTERPE